ncbi:hypothetical protein BaRGS_00015670 [Batillaria attramentaria]|uniref:Uncharacterized protein n=1 Tax=Batillaria attramentaria TaxID=370345 RepID=A0ABD0L219_9CAEN
MPKGHGTTGVKFRESACHGLLNLAVHRTQMPTCEELKNIGSEKGEKRYGTWSESMVLEEGGWSSQACVNRCDGKSQPPTPQCDRRQCRLTVQSIAFLGGTCNTAQSVEGADGYESGIGKEVSRIMCSAEIKPQLRKLDRELQLFDRPMSSTIVMTYGDLSE